MDGYVGLENKIYTHATANKNDLMKNTTGFDYQALYGDIHNHCNISYAHGSLDDAIKNAALRLDFASITGHASWPDMDEHDPRIQHIVQFHQRGFAKLHNNWDNYLDRISHTTFDTAKGREA